MRASADMFTLNETAADIAGRELGDTVFARMGGDLSISPGRYGAAEDRDPNFTREMRKTRREAESLLAEGKVDQAEELMKQSWWFLALRGYGLRKLNQAYFAFRGSYAESPASLSPIGDELRGASSLPPRRRLLHKNRVWLRQLPGSPAGLAGAKAAGTNRRRCYRLGVGG